MKRFSNSMSRFRFVQCHVQRVTNYLRAIVYFKFILLCIGYGKEASVTDSTEGCRTSADYRWNARAITGLYFIVALYGYALETQVLLIGCGTECKSWVTAKGCWHQQIGRTTGEMPDTAKQSRLGYCSCIPSWAIKWSNRKSSTGKYNFKKYKIILIYHNMYSGNPIVIVLRTAEIILIGEVALF